jgi:hypothetical protein
MNRSLLGKTDFTISLNSSKLPNTKLSLVRKKNLRKLKTLCIGYNTHETHFVLSDFIRQSKKLRSNVIEKVEMDISLYSLKAIILRERATINRPWERTYLIRNVFSSVPYEANVILQSPAIDFAARDYSNPRFYKRKAILFLRQKPLPQSKITFIYITGIISSTSHLGKEDVALTSNELYHQQSK